MSTLTWITEKELQREREMKNKGFVGKTTRKFCSSGEKMRNSSGQAGENEQQ